MSISYSAKLPILDIVTNIENSSGIPWFRADCASFLSYRPTHPVKHTSKYFKVAVNSRHLVEASILRMSILHGFFIIVPSLSLIVSASTCACRCRVAPTLLIRGSPPSQPLASPPLDGGARKFFTQRPCGSNSIRASRH